MVRVLKDQWRANPAQERALRQDGRATARRYAWPHVVQRLLLPRLHHMAETARSHDPQPHRTTLR